jgi:hypothetical protein
VTLTLARNETIVLTMKHDAKLGREMKVFIDAELRKANLLPPDELHAILEPWMAPLRQSLEFVRQLQQSWVDWIQQNREQLAAFNNFTQQAALAAGEFIVAADTASKSFAITLDRLQGLAGQGWTLPTQLSVAELNEFAQLEDSLAADFMMKKFEGSDPEFKQMEERLLSDPQLKEYSTILPQCFRAIRREDFAIAVPSLMAMLERVIQSLNPPSLAASTNVRKTLRDDSPVAKRAQHDLFCAAIFFTLATVIADLWGEYPLQADGATVLSRPAIQHGRIEPPNSKYEVVRLLNTLETALALHDQLDDSGLPPWGMETLDKRQQGFRAVFAATFYLPRGK